MTAHKTSVLRERPPVHQHVSSGGMWAEVWRLGIPWEGCLLSFVRGSERPGKCHLSRDLDEVRRWAFEISGTSGPSCERKHTWHVWEWGRNTSSGVGGRGGILQGAGQMWPVGLHSATCYLLCRFWAKEWLSLPAGAPDWVQSELWGCCGSAGPRPGIVSAEISAIPEGRVWEFVHGCLEVGGSLRGVGKLGHGGDDGNGPWRLRICSPLRLLSLSGVCEGGAVWS